MTNTSNVSQLCCALFTCTASALSPNRSLFPNLSTLFSLDGFTVGKRSPFNLCLLRNQLPQRCQSQNRKLIWVVRLVRACGADGQWHWCICNNSWSFEQDNMHGCRWRGQPCCTTWQEQFTYSPSFVVRQPSQWDSVFGLAFTTSVQSAWPYDMRSYFYYQLLRCTVKGSYGLILFVWCFLNTCIISIA